MDPLNQQTPIMPNASASEHKKVGPIISILVIVLILIIGALYLFASKINQQSNPTGANQAQQSVQAITNKSDDINDLQADLNAATQGLDNQNF